MKAAVYPFPEVLRSLRKQAGVSVLKAGELTSYTKYERWESGRTSVGAHHLQNIAAAFGVGDELWLLVYAWIVDRFTPQPGGMPVDLSGDALQPLIANLPDAPVDLGEHRHLALRDATHTQLALFGLVARYGQGQAGASAQLVLAPAERTTVPSVPAEASVLRYLYGDVERDQLRFLGRTLILSGLGALAGRAQRDVTRQMMLLATEPECVGQLLAAGAPRTKGRLRGFDRLAALAARVGPQFERMTGRHLEGLRRLTEAELGAPASLDDVKAELCHVVCDDDLWDSPSDRLEEIPEVDGLPEPDPVLGRQMRALFDELDRAARRALNEQLDDAQAVADPSVAFEALHILEGGPR